MSILSTPRFTTAAGNRPPGNHLIWEMLVNQSDAFAFHTANITKDNPEGKGGPFGAQLWLYNPDNNQFILVGTAQDPEDSNAVVIKGQASAHAEAESLSPEKRQQVIEFLRDRSDENWQVVQVSSGESCPSCRSKQVVFANELIREGLIDEQEFHVVFKATYDQTKRDADFNDAPYDQAIRAIRELKVLEENGSLLGLEEAFLSDDLVVKQIESGEIVYVPVNPTLSAHVPENVDKIFLEAGEQPTAVILRKNGEVLSYALDVRDLANDGLNLPEKTAIVGAIEGASNSLRDDEDKFDSWDLEGATVYTNILNIGPMSYSAMLWSNLAEVRIVTNYTSDVIDDMAQEVPGMSNSSLFLQVAADYDSRVSPLSVVFNGDPDEASAAHLVWKARMQMEAVKNAQAERVRTLSDAGQMPKITFIDGSTVDLTTLIETSDRSSNYDGTQAQPQSGKLTSCL